MIDYIRDIVHEAGFIPDAEFFKSRNNRKKLYKSDSKSFLSVGKNGTPVFAVKNQYGGVSISVLKRSLSSARRLYNKTNDKKYKGFVNKIEFYMKALERKALRFPRSYKVNGNLEKILKKTRDLGSLSNLGGLND